MGSLLDEEQRLHLLTPGPRLSHYAFRYPAKFHPPVIRALLDRYVGPSDTVLDNFCGSGTLMVEAAASGRHSIGVDVDPVAVLVSTAKTRVYNAEGLRQDAATVAALLGEVERPQAEYDRRMFDDLDEEEFALEVATDDLWVPAIPRLDHWFRRYVSVDLARILRVIETAEVNRDSRVLLALALAASIRNVSNADPVPVSGLEVTSHMRKKDETGRRINPVDQFRSVLKKTVDAVLKFSEAVTADLCPVVFEGDATKLPARMPVNVDAVITSPPYHNAVDYYRRHQLEMFWLGFVKDQADRLNLLPHYIGRHRIPAKHLVLKEEWKPGPLANEWHDRMAEVDQSRANDFRHYMVSMQRVFAELGRVRREGAPIIMVVGESAWRGAVIPTGDLLAEAASAVAELDKRLWYPIKNRYMSYSRHNGADISQEHVLIFR